MNVNLVKEMTPAGLYFNCLYSSVAHAINNLKDPFFAYEQSWDGNNYNYHYGAGRGTISFDMQRGVVAGAARDEESDRIGWYPQYKAIDLFANAGIYVKQLAEREALEYLYDKKEGVTQPMATIAFWIENNQLFICEQEDVFRLNGGEYLEIIAAEFEDVRKYWTEQYRLEEEVEIVDYIYDCITDYKTINKKIVKKIINPKQSGYKECLESLQEIKAVIK